jgi:uncharacterized integral membrane protein (TIGR00698 family)
MLRRLGPGLVVLAALGAAARLVAAVVPSTSALVVAIVIGLVVANAVGVPDWARPGAGTHKLWLETGIVLMGAGVGLGRVVAAGPQLLALVVLSVTATIVAVEAFARFAFSIHEETGSLLAAGSGICGVSAVVATAESIGVDEARLAYAAATILLFDTVMVFVYPFVGHWLDLSGTVFGVWAGLTMFSTGPVTAAGFAFSEVAGEWAVLVKLTRNSLIGVAAIVYAVTYAARRSDAAVEGRGRVRFLWDTFPKFVLGFFAVLLVANAGLLDAGQIASLRNVSNWAFLLAFAGLGLDIDLADLRATGYRPILAVLSGLLVVATAMLLIVQATF